MVVTHVPDGVAAAGWFAAEEANLVQTIAVASANGFDAHAWQLPWCLAGHFDRRGQWADWVATQQAALAAAKRLGDLRAQARTRISLGFAQVQIGAYTDADDQLRKARTVFATIGDPVGEAHTCRDRALLLERQNRHQDALTEGLMAFTLYRAAKHPSGQADALSQVAWHHARLGEHVQALQLCRTALRLHRLHGSVAGQAGTLHTIGYVQHRLGRHTVAVSCFLQALVRYQQLDIRYFCAETLIHLGDSQHAAGNRSAAERAWRQAETILDALRHPAADEVRTRLTAKND